MTKEVRSENGTAVVRDGFPRGRDLRISSFPRHSSSVIRHFLGGCCVALLSGTLPAQLALPPETNLFGDDIVRKIDVGGRFAGGEEMEDAKPKPKVPGFGHALVFQDGRQLRGELVELTKREVVWRRPDASEPFRFARDEVWRVVLAPGAENGNPGGGRFDVAEVDAYVRTMVQHVAEALGGVIAEGVAQSVTVDLGRAVRIPHIVHTMTLQMTETMREMDMGKNAGASGDAEKLAESATATLKLPGGDWLFGGVTSAAGETFALKLADEIGRAHV